jgi:hypothetical protein
MKNISNTHKNRIKGTFKFIKRKIPSYTNPLSEFNTQSPDLLYLCIKDSPRSISSGTS